VGIKCKPAKKKQKGRDRDKRVSNLKTFEGWRKGLKSMIRVFSKREEITCNERSGQ